MNGFRLAIMRAVLREIMHLANVLVLVFVDENAFYDWYHIDRN